MQAFKNLLTFSLLSMTGMVFIGIFILNILMKIDVN